MAIVLQRTTGPISQESTRRQITWVKIAKAIVIKIKFYLIVTSMCRQTEALLIYISRTSSNT